jgi:hypothetical protein
MGTFTFDATPTEAQLRAVMRRAGRSALMILRGLGVVLIVYGFAQLFDAEFPPSFAIGMAVAGVLVVVFLPRYKLRRAMRTTVARLGRPTSYRIDDTGISTASDLSNGTIRWPMVRAIEELGQAGVVMARVGKAMVVPIPISGLAPDVRAALLTFMHAHATAPAVPAPPAPDAVAPGIPAATAGAPVDFRPSASAEIRRPVPPG